VFVARVAVDKAEIVKRISEAMSECITIAVAKEQHHNEGYHFHAGIILGKGILAKSAPKTFREILPEFEGAQFNLSYHRAFHSWN